MNSPVIYEYYLLSNYDNVHASGLGIFIIGILALTAVLWPSVQRRENRTAY